MKKYITIFFLSFFIFLIILGGVYYYINSHRIGEPLFDQIVEERPDLKPPDPDADVVINTLIMGVDQARSDIMIIASYNKSNNKITMLSIPRDTRVSIPGYGSDKVNAAAAKKEGAALAMETISNLINMPIHHYVKIDFKGAEKLVDILGGVTVNVPMDMDYEDPSQNLSIHIKKGVRTLNGADAVRFVRFRSGYVDQDLGRIRAQQEFIRAFVKKMTSPKVLPKAFSLVDAMTKCIKTNMTQGEIAKYALKVGDIKLDNIKMYTLPGKPGYMNGISYYIYDEKQLANTLSKIKEDLGVADANASTNTPTQSVQNTNNGTQATNTAEGQQNMTDKKDIKIEIINTTGKSGLAAQVKAELESKGYKVAKIGSVKGLVYNYSRVFDKKGNKDSLEMVAKDAGINMTDSDIDNSYEYDITIIIGKDRYQ